MPISSAVWYLHIYPVSHFNHIDLANIHSIFVFLNKCKVKEIKTAQLLTWDTYTDGGVSKINVAVDQVFNVGDHLYTSSTVSSIPTFVRLKIENV